MRELAEEIVKIVNDTTNDYDAIEKVQEHLLSVSCDLKDQE